MYNSIGSTFTISTLRSSKLQKNVEKE